MATAELQKQPIDHGVDTTLHGVDTEGLIPASLSLAVTTPCPAVPTPWIAFVFVFVFSVVLAVAGGATRG
jgi:hypothetical protein